MITLGSDPINTTHGAGGSEVDANDWNVNQLQGAVYESGQDNSPMYDEVRDASLSLLSSLFSLLSSLFSLSLLYRPSLRSLSHTGGLQQFDTPGNN
jgi:hypothetical protein